MNKWGEWTMYNICRWLSYLHQNDWTLVLPWYVFHIKKFTNTLSTGLNGRVWWIKMITVRAAGGHTLSPGSCASSIGSSSPYTTCAPAYHWCSVALSHLCWLWLPTNDCMNFQTLVTCWSAKDRPCTSSGSSCLCGILRIHLSRLFAVKVPSLTSIPRTTISLEKSTPHVTGNDWELVAKLVYLRYEDSFFGPYVVKIT